MAAKEKMGTTDRPTWEGQNPDQERATQPMQTVLTWVASSRGGLGASNVVIVIVIVLRLASLVTVIQSRFMIRWFHGLSVCPEPLTVLHPSPPMSSWLLSPKPTVYSETWQFQCFPTCMLLWIPFVAKPMHTNIHMTYT